MQWTLGGVAVVLFCLAAWMFWNKDMPKLTNFFGWTVGIAVALGAIGGWLSGLIQDALNLATTTSAAAAGVGVAAVGVGIGLVMNLEVIIKGFWFKRAKPRRMHFPLGIVAPTVAIATGVPALTTIFGYVAETVSQVGGSLG